MITERQRAFRQEYRSRIVGWYDGYAHILIIYAIGAAAFYIYIQHLRNVTWLEWLTVPVAFLFTNIFEWAVHKFIMHRPVKLRDCAPSTNVTRSITISFSLTMKCDFVTIRIGV